MGKLHLSRNDLEVHAWAERRGVRVFEIRATLDRDLPPLPPVAQRRSPLTGEIDENSKWGWGGFRVKFLRKAGSSSLPPEEVFDFGPVITEMGSVGGKGFTREGARESCTLDELNLKHSPFDSTWSRLPVKKVLSVSYQKGNSFTMLSGRIVEGVKVDVEAFAELSKYYYDY